MIAGFKTKGHEWNRTKFGNIIQRKKLLLARLEGLDHGRVASNSSSL